MKRPVLVIMAAGMGSRYGSLKYTVPIDSDGSRIIDFSLFDAYKAGFRSVICVIRRAEEDSFREAMGRRIERYFQVSYAYQENSLPADCEKRGDFFLLKGRIKPFGTAHAVLSCKDQLDGPFAVINADDFYGRHAFASMYSELKKLHDVKGSHYLMIGYRLKDTLTDFGYVARGICRLGESGYLRDIVERTHVEKRGKYTEYSENGGKSWHVLQNDSVVSMNMWGFTKGIMDDLEKGFRDFIDNELVNNPMGGEFFLPTAVNDLIAAKKAEVEVIEAEDQWYGITYHEDEQPLIAAIEEMKKTNIYPRHLWRKD